MSKLYITEYADQSRDSRGAPMSAGMEPALATQVVDYGAGVAASGVLNAKTRLVRVHTDAICSVKFGTAPVATTNDARMGASQTEYYTIEPTAAKLGTMKVSGITNV